MATLVNEAELLRLATGLEFFIHQALHLSSIYPKGTKISNKLIYILTELFENVPYGSFTCSRSRHPKLNEYIAGVRESLVKLLRLSTFECLTLKIVDDGTPVAEWIIEVEKSIPDDLFGSVYVKMKVMASLIPVPLDPDDRTFEIITKTKECLSGYRLANMDWIYADQLCLSLVDCKIYPCKSFRSPNTHVI